MRGWPISPIRRRRRYGPRRPPWDAFVTTITENLELAERDVGTRHAVAQMSDQQWETVQPTRRKLHAVYQQVIQAAQEDKTLRARLQLIRPRDAHPRDLQHDGQRPSRRRLAAAPRVICSTGSGPKSDRRRAVLESWPFESVASLSQRCCRRQPRAWRRSRTIAPGPSSQTIASAISPGSATLPIGRCDPNSLAAASSGRPGRIWPMMSANWSVSVGPGQTAFTRMPRLAVSSAADRVRPITACLPRCRWIRSRRQRAPPWKRRSRSPLPRSLASPGSDASYRATCS